MTVHEYGTGNRIIVLVHPSAVMWDYFDYLIPLLKEEYHLIIPALPGYDEENPDENFTSVEETAAVLSNWLTTHKIKTVNILYGCSMGGSIVLRILAEQHITAKNIVCDGGITPYQLPRIATRLIAVRDFLMVAMGKLGGLTLLEKAFSTDEYSSEDLKYIAKVLQFMSFKTIWRTFESCNNYTMPRPVPKYHGRFQYWYGDKEEKQRAWDIKYIKKSYPDAEFIKLENMGHASMASLHPREMAERFRLLSEA